MADPAPLLIVPRRGITRGECFGFLALVFVLAWPFGIFDRFPFDDEIGTLDLIARYSPSELIVTRLGEYDITPPISYLNFQVLVHFGVPIWGMRLVSLIMSAIAFLLILDLTLAMVCSRDKIVRLATMFLFISFPLLYGVGDALRWWPVFTNIRRHGFF